MATRASLKQGSYTQLGYRAAEVARLSGRPAATGGSADFHTRYDREQLVRQSQSFDRDNGLYKGVINRAVDNIIGDGFALQARTGDEETNKKIERLWADFCVEPEVRGLHSWWQIERMVIRSLWVDGDIGGIKTDSGRVQVIEAERLAGGRRASNEARDSGAIEQGVELDSLGRPIAYWVSGYDPISGQVRKQNAKRIAAADYLYIANLDRPSQTRGVPVMVCNFPMFHRINDVCDSEAIAWQLLSRLAIAITKKDGPAVATTISEADPDRVDATAKDISSRIQDLDAGTIFQGDLGEEIKGIERNLPGSNFTASVTMFLRLLGLPVGFPLELILLDWSKTNYSSARAALEQAFRMFQCWQRLLKARWHTPIYVWKIQQWIDAGELTVIPDIFKHEWISPSFPWIDQLKEAEAWGIRIERGLATHAEAQKSLNKDRGDWLDVRKDEIEGAIKTAEELNKKYPGANVSWQIFAGMADAKPATTPPAAQPQPEEKEEKNADAA